MCHVVSSTQRVIAHSKTVIVLDELAHLKPQLDCVVNGVEPAIPASDVRRVYYTAICKLLEEPFEPVASV